MGNEDSHNNEGLLEAEEIELDADEHPDLENVMRDALDAVEQSGGERPAAGSSGDDGAEEPPAGEVAAFEVARLRQEITDLRDRSVRTLADFENYRKRIDRERRDERRYAAFEVLREFLGVVDNLERALASEGPAEDLKVGVDLILRQMKDLARSHGVERVPAAGERFDPNLHEAVSRDEDPTVAAPTVSEELQAGYRMHDRLLRPAIVKVAMPPEGSDSGDDAPPSDPSLIH